jgi:Bacterial Ig-like domain (group 3)/FG-GAP-like repeat
MRNQKKLLRLFSFAFLAIAPIVLFAYEYGSDPGYSGAPGDNATGCIASGCHTGTLNSGNGSVKIVASGGTTYVPGQTQTIVVSITDPAERKYGFQLTARANSNPRTTEAGLLIPGSDGLTQTLCADGSNAPPTGCTARNGGTLEWIEQTLAGYSKSGTPPTYSYIFTWTPPTTNVGPVTLYAAGNAVTGAVVVTGTNTYTTSLQLTPVTLTSSSVTLASSPNPATYGHSVTFAATVSPSSATGKVTFYDGTTILGTKALVGGEAMLTTSLLPAGARSLRVYYLGDSVNAPSTSTAVSQTVGPLSLPANGLIAGATYSADAEAIAVGDFNGDGKADLVVPGSNLVFLGNGDGTFQTPLNFPGSGGAVVVGDFNGDGKADLAVGGSVLLGNGNGSFQPAVTYVASGSSMALGDFNGDGATDLVSIGSDGEATVLLNTAT